MLGFLMQVLLMSALLDQQDAKVSLIVEVLPFLQVVLMLHLDICNVIFQFVWHTKCCWLDFSNQKPNKRNIVYLFQEALLFPHLNVFENIAFGLRIRKESSENIRIKVYQILQQLGIESEASKLPDQISGGQKQRVAFGRAIIINPPLLLLDEPFSNLDVETRASMQNLYKRMAASYNITALFVTHDLKESLIMGDRIAYMENGNLSMYEDRKAFIRDAKTGVHGEINFWNTLN